MAETAANLYGAMVRAAERDRSGVASRSPGGEEPTDRWKAGAPRYREDPFREHDTLHALLAYIQPADTVLDVGGGAGRYLPIALHCREYVNVEPSPGMGAQFELSVREAGIENARWLQSDWLGRRRRLLGQRRLLHRRPRALHRQAPRRQPSTGDDRHALGAAEKPGCRPVLVRPWSRADS